jgi:signal transduction histidine kinase/ActR/RegA family two-component response regulator
MTRFRDLLQREKSLPAAVALLAALLLLTGLWIISQSENRYRAEQQDQARIQASILAASVTAALDFGDRVTAQESVDALRASPNVQAAGVYNAAGRRLAGYMRNNHPLSASAAKIDSPPRKVLQATMPVVRSGTRIGTVYLAYSVEPLARRLSRYAMIALLLFMTMLVVTVLGVSYAALRRANRGLAGQASSLADANRELQIQMEERARAEEQLRQAQKMQALGQLTGGIAHDFNNMLTVIQGSADILGRPVLTEEKRIRFANAIAETAGRAASLTGQLLAFARRQPLAPVPLALNERIRDMIPLLDPLLGVTIKLQLDFAADLHAVEADAAQLQAAILNIVMNARDAMPDGGTVTIRTRNVAKEEAGDGADTVALSIIDTGPGLDPAMRDRVFEPFFTTKSVGKGTGLGLSQVYGFVHQSGGEVRIEGEAGKGAEVVMLLPASNRIPDAQAAEPGTAGQRTTGRILLVEDNPQVGAFAETLLSELGHDVVRATNGIEALQLTDEGALYDVVFTDVVMPGMGGLELAGELKRRRPGLPIILTTGYSDRIASAGAEGHAVIPKPYRLETIANALEAALLASRAHPA